MKKLNFTVEKILKEISEEIIKENKKLLAKQHLIYKLTGPCHPAIDFIVKEVLKK